MRAALSRKCGKEILPKSPDESIQLSEHPTNALALILKDKKYK